MNSIMNYGIKKTNLLQGSEIFTQEFVMVIEIEIYFKFFLKFVKNSV